MTPCLSLAPRTHCLKPAGTPLLFMLLSACTSRAPDAADAGNSAKSASAGLVTIAAIQGRSIDLQVQAPDAHALYFENCNGAINWGLLPPAGGAGSAPVWSVMRNQCLSPPIVIQAGARSRFRLQLPPPGEYGPAPGRYRIMLMGVFNQWAANKPLSQPQIPAARLTTPAVDISS